jgi:hypothetical protein
MMRKSLQAVTSGARVLSQPQSKTHTINTNFAIFILSPRPHGPDDWLGGGFGDWERWRRVVAVKGANNHVNRGHISLQL